MNINKWLNNNIGLLDGKKAIVTGATGGLGRELCFLLAKQNANITLAVRNETLANNLKQEILEKYPNIVIDFVPLDLSNLKSIDDCINKLKDTSIDYFFINAGVYNIPLKKLNTGFNNIFQINFVSPYYMVKKLMPNFEKNKTRIIAVSSIAHNYSKINESDIDFSSYKKPSKIYGNSKRFLMFSLYELFKNEQSASLAIVHPGITLTNMTNHYPRAINWLVKIGIKILFPSTKKAVLNILKGVSESTPYHIWIGPKLFNIWGNPSVKKLKTCSITESQTIFKLAEKIFISLNK